MRSLNSHAAVISQQVFCVAWVLTPLGLHQRRQGRRGPDRRTAVPGIPLFEALSTARWRRKFAPRSPPNSRFPGSICC